MTFFRPLYSAPSAGAGDSPTNGEALSVWPNFMPEQTPRGRGLANRRTRPTTTCFQLKESRYVQARRRRCVCTGSSEFRAVRHRWSSSAMLRARSLAVAAGASAAAAAWRPAWSDGGRPHQTGGQVGSGMPGDATRVHKIVITGGPCAGKATAMSKLSLRLQNLGFAVYVVPELATLTITGGAGPRRWRGPSSSSGRRRSSRRRWSSRTRSRRSRAAAAPSGTRCS